MTAACILAGGAFAEPVGKQALPGAAAPVADAPVEPAAGDRLEFFTIAQRVAALRAAGRLPQPADSGSRPQIVHASVTQEIAEPVLRPAVSQPQLLGMAMIAVPGGELAAKWQGMAARWEAEKTTIEGCRTGPCQHQGAARWLQVEAAAGKLTGAEQLSYVHVQINRSIGYASDFAARGAADHWASPLESLEKIGDCEDYAIAKYMMLRALGRSAEDLKLVVLYQPWSGMYHAILAVRTGESWTHLDNQRASLTSERDYRGVRAIATLDENGQALLAAMPKSEPQAALSAAGLREAF